MEILIAAVIYAAVNWGFSAAQEPVSQCYVQINEGPQAWEWQAPCPYNKKEVE